MVTTISFIILTCLIMTAPNKVLLEKAEKVGLKVASGNTFLGGYIGCEIDKNKFVKEK